MKKKIFIISASVLVLFSVVGVCVYAGLEALNTRIDEKTKELALPDTYVRKEAAEEKTISLPNSTPVEVTYNRSQQITEDQSIDIYTDENNIEYEADTDTGAVVGYYNNDVLTKEVEDNTEITLTPDSSTASTTDQPLTIKIDGQVTQEQAILIATAEAKRIFPNEYQKFAYHSANLYIQNESYLVVFAEYCGKGNFIIARCIKVMVAKNGEIALCIMSGREELAQFDYSLLDHVTYDMIKETVDKELSQAKTLISYEISRICVIKENGIYRVQIETAEYYPPPEYCAVNAYARVYYYDFPQ